MNRWAGRAILCIALSHLGGCARIIAGRLIEAQNGKMPRVDAPPSVLAEHLVTKQLRIPVGPPDAQLSIWIMDPFDRPGKLRLVPDGHGHPVLQIKLAPTSRPPTTFTTAPTTARAPKGTLFILHGLADNKELVPYQLWATIFRGSLYRVILVDLRGHGRSTGDRITYGVWESHDMVQLLDALNRLHEIVGDVGVLGGSYGGAIAIQWAAIDPRVKAVVAVEPFATLREAADDASPFLLGRKRWMFPHSTIQSAVTRGGKLAGVNVDEANPLKAIARCQTPVLLIHGKDDQLLKPLQSEQLHAAAPDHSRLVLVDHGNHFNLWYVGMNTIHSEAIAWLKQYLSPLATEPTTQPRQ